MSGPNSQPTFPRTFNLGRALISTANTNRDGTGSLGTVATGATDGTRIDRVLVQAIATTTAGMVRLFLDDGSAVYLLAEIPVSAITPSGTVVAFADELVRADGQPVVTLQSGWHLKASTHNAESFNVLSFGADY